MAQQRRSKRLNPELTLTSCVPTERHAKHRKTHPPLASAGLDDLPEELIVIILEATASHEIPGTPKDHRKTLHSLSLTSRKYYRLASPYLYFCINNRYVGTGKALKSLAKQPQVGRNVKRLFWLDDEIFSDYTWDTKLPYRLSQKERYEFYKIIGSTTLEDSDVRALRRAIRRQSPDDLLSMFLLLSPNVEVLEIEDANNPEIWHSPLWLRLLTHASFGSLESTQNFQRLSHIVVHMGPILLETVVPVLGLPALRTLVLTNAVQIGSMTKYRQDLGYQAVSSSSLESLRVTNSVIDTDAICQMLDMIKGLKEFHFEWQTGLSGSEEPVFDQYLNLSYHSLRNAFDRHSNTLESLCVVDHEPSKLVDDLDYLDNHDNQNWLGSLRDMHNVRKLEVSLRAFRDTTKDRHATLCDTLPPNIECLTIHIEDFGIVQKPVQARWWICSLRDLLKDCKKIYPHLKTIVVCDSRKSVLRIDDDVRELWTSFTEQGISLVIEGGNPTVPDLLFTRTRNDDILGSERNLDCARLSVV